MLLRSRPTTSHFHSLSALSCLVIWLLLSSTVVLALEVTPQQAKVLQNKQQPTTEQEASQAPTQPSTVRLSPAVAQQLSAQQLQQLQQQANALREQHQRVRLELEDDQERVVQDLTFLWQAAVERSGSIRYAVEKLSQRDASGQSTKKAGLTRKIITGLAQLGGAAGTIWTGSPVGLLSGSMVTEVVRDSDPTVNRKVTDADMVILAKAVESLQSDLMRNYYQYRFAQERQVLMAQALDTIHQHYSRALSAIQNDPQRHNLETLMRSTLASVEQDARQCEMDVHQSRTALALLVGTETLAALELGRSQSAATPMAESVSPTVVPTSSHK